MKYSVYHYTRRYMRSTKIRILAAFMAVLIFSLTFTDLIGQLGIRVKADEFTYSDSPIITTDSTKTHFSNIKNVTDGIYSYTGNLQTAKVSMFDYVSDAEFINGYSYNNLSHTTPFGGYDDAFTAFNYALSNSARSIKTSSDQNTTIKFKSTGNKCSRAYVYFWDSTTACPLSWPGIPMTFNPTDNCFYLTIPNSVLGNNAKAKINGGKNSNGNDTWKSDEFSIANLGKEYYWEMNVWDDENYDYEGNSAGKPWTDGQTDAKPIYNTNYDYPLYFGVFYHSDNASDYTLTKYPKNFYNNFYWQPNLALRSDNNASVQSLVYGTLNGGSYTGSLLSSNNQLLPYFDPGWATGTNANLMKYYTESGKGDEYIAFPFYEVLANASDSNIAGENKSSSTAKAKFHEFNSEKTNIKFVGNQSTHAGYFEETTTPIYSNWSNIGFFPFNTTNNSQKNNLGFGAKFEMTFKLEEDGCVGVVNANGEDLEYNETTQPERIHTIFEFEGDDDLWVYLDGNLLLDMGGSHFKSKGKIDFAANTATVDKCIDISTQTDKDKMDPTVTSNSKDISSAIKAGTYSIQDNKIRYQSDKSHTLTIFYMERGMGDSNLMIRYNYDSEKNFSRMKIREVTDFGNVNKGLVNVTQKAADNDVFEYWTVNTDNVEFSVKNSGIKYPNKVNHTRTVQGINTVLTSSSNTATQSENNFVPADSTGTYNVANTNYYWVDQIAGMISGDNKGSGQTDANGKLYLMFGTKEDNNVNTSENESSAEFTKQFRRNSTMQITQGTCLYSPDRTTTPVATLNNNNIRGSGTQVSEYYDTSVVLVDYNYTNSWNKNNGDTFNFNNGDGTNGTTKVDDNISVMLTEYFTNTPKTGAMTITKAEPSAETVHIDPDKEFTIKVRFEDIFGVEEVDADNETDYTGIKYKVYDSSGTLVNGDGTMTSGTVKVTEGGNEVEKYCGTFKLKVGQTATVEGIPYKTKYIVYENEPKYAPTYDNNNSTVLVGTIDDSSHKAVPLNSTTPNNNNITVTNFSHTLTIKEVTDFSGVNAGLISYTKTAAEKDVFKYTVSNQNTSDSDLVDSGIKTPTYDEYKRGNVTLTKQQPIQYDYVYDYDSIFLDVKIDDSNYWDSGDYVIAATFQDNTTPNAVNTDFIIGEKIEGTTVYKFTGYSDDAVKVRFFRLYASQAPFVTETNLWPDDAKISHKAASTLSFNGGDLFKITGWGGTDKKSPCQKDDDNSPYPVDKSVIYNLAHNYKPSLGNAVANTNYEWTDEFAGLVGSNADGINGMTGTTGNNGEFYLMHGTEVYTKNSVTYTQDKESSAKFYNQFARGSTMTVVQSDTLTSPNGGTPDTLKANNQRGASTSRATYYTTTKTLEGSYTTQPAASGTLDEAVNSFEFDNTTRDTGKSIRITETFTNTVKTGSITISKKVSGDESYNDTFRFRIILKDVFGVTGNNVENNGYGEITITNAFNANGTDNTAGKLAEDGTFYVKQGIYAVISGIPVETTYQIVETTKSGWSASYKIGDSGSFNSGASTPASGNKISSNGITVSFINTPPAPSTNEIILTKTAKEKVGITEIGSILTGAKFLLYKADDNTLAGNFTFSSGEYTYNVSGTFNSNTNSTSYMETGSDSSDADHYGKLTLKGLPLGDYYLKEMAAPTGYSAIDSNTGTNRCVYFSVGTNTTTKEITMSDEMAPAYIKLFEHINEYRPTEWGNPTFIFKITQTHYYSNSGTLTEYSSAANRRTHIVALTVDDDGKLITDNILGLDYNNWYQESTDEEETVNSSTVREYMGMYHIDSEGKIRLEPGTYSITRVPVSRYEFVADTWKLQNDNTADIYTTNKRTETNKSTGTESAVTITIPANDTGIVHYYDKVAYYDKFTHVDTKINKFYKLNESTNANETIKGLIVRYDGKAGTSTNTINITTDANFKAKLIYVDGSERELSNKSNITIDANSNSDITVSDDGKTITVQNPSSHLGKVYTLKAKYDNKFETTFELVFERAP